MPLHLTKVAFGAQSMEDLRSRIADHGNEVRLTTRYLPKRHAEIVDQSEGGGSLYWIFKHALVARSPILRFEDAENGKTHIVLSAQLIDVRPVPRRAHQGWRYLDGKDAPPDLAGGSEGGDVLPGSLVSELAKLGLV
jgi:hypothetical protein